MAQHQTTTRRKTEHEMMTVSADSKEELDETISEHMLDGWREIGRTSDRDGTFHAKLVKYK